MMIICKIRRKIIGSDCFFVNLSDHIPVVYKFNWVLSSQIYKSGKSAVKRYSWRWDKSDLSNYYHLSDLALRNVSVPAMCDCVLGCCNAVHLDAINTYYENIVTALHHAACSAIQRVPCHALKPYWNEELDRLKTDSIFWHNLWTNAGRPSSGALQRIRLACRAKYKLAIRNAYVTFEDKLSDELYLHFVNKNIPDFWKTWNARFRKNVSRHVNINGHANDVEIANEFAVHFTKVFDNSRDDSVACNNYLHKRSECMKNGLQSSYDCVELVDVQLIEQCLQRLKKGKACGPDELCAEHLYYAHPALLVHMKVLFKLIISHGFVPNSFGYGITIPLVKDKAGNINDVDNYRAITLSPIISKLFEVVLLTVCGDALNTDSLQFGFKDSVGCADAIFTLKSTMEYFVDRGSSVYIASLDISKAFDRVNHYKLYQSLLSAGVPVIIVDILHNWYSKLFFAVRWNGELSAYFAVGSGVRQGSCLSPAIFNVFMNLFISQLKLQGMGCHVFTLFLGCLLYADDIILLSPSVAGLQTMLNKCSDIACTLSLQFNVNKSHCIVVGKSYKIDITPMSLSGTTIEWCKSIKYLGVHLLNGKSVKFDINPTKRNFYAACNSIFMHGSGVDEIAMLTLQESYSLSVLMYAAPALTLSRKQTDELNVCWNSVIRRLFGYNRWESVKAVLMGLGRLNIKHLIMLRKTKFYRHLFLAYDSFLRDVFYVFLLHNSDNDPVLKSVFCTASAAVKYVWTSFEMYVNL